ARWAEQQIKREGRQPGRNMYKGMLLVWTVEYEEVAAPFNLVDADRGQCIIEPNEENLVAHKISIEQAKSFLDK
ncbi:unnamed protein product, partial [Prorocentrum cordatum]